MAEKIQDSIITGSHINIDDGNTDALSELQDLPINQFAMLEVASWITSNDDNI